MRFALMIEPQQGLELRRPGRDRQAGRGERLRGAVPLRPLRELPGRRRASPTTDAWTVIAGLARETDRIGLGALVSPVTFRHPGTFAKVVTTVDEMSGGRIEVGVGAGWNEVEHRQLGLPFPAIGERADLLEDQLAILHGLWGEPDGWSYDGKHGHDPRTRSSTRSRSTVPGRPTGKNGAPRPRDHLRRRRRRRAAAGSRRRTRDEFNTHRRSPETVAETFAKLDAACAAIGRDPATLVRSAMVGALVGRTDDEVRRRERRAARRRSATTPAATSGSRSAATAGSSGRRRRGARDGPALRRRRRRADHAPGLHPVGPRPHRRDGRGARSAGSSRGHGPAASGSARRRPRPRRSAGRRGGSGPGPCRAPGRSARSGAGAGSPCRAARRRAPGGPAPRRPASRPAGVSAGSSAPSTSAARIAADADARGRRAAASAWRARASRSARPVAVGEDRTSAVSGRSPAGGRGGTSRGRGTRTAATTPPRS